MVPKPLRLYLSAVVSLVDMVSELQGNNGEQVVVGVRGGIGAEKQQGQSAG